MKTLLFILLISVSVFPATFSTTLDTAESYPTPPVTEQLFQNYPANFRVTRQGVTFNTVAAFGGNGFSFGMLSPYLNPTSATPFKIEWNYPSTAVSIWVVDNQPDTDAVTMKGFDCSNRQIGETSITIPGNGTVATSRQVSLMARGLCSMEIIGGSVGAEHSVYYDNLKVSTDNNPNAFTGFFYSDFAVFRPVNGTWYFNANRLFFDYKAIPFGANDDKPFSADFENDGAADFGVFRNGVWYIWRNCAGVGGTGGGNLSFCGYRTVAFGANGDIPTQADYDGDGKTDVAVFRPTTGYWYILRSSDNQVSYIQFGQNEDIPATGFYDGDGKADIAVFRPSNGTWYILGSESGFRGVPFGQSGDKPVMADYDGDAITDIAIYRGGSWYILQSSNGQFRGISFGLPSDIPTPSDYKESGDNAIATIDGKANIAVYRPSSGTFYVLAGTGFYAYQWGQQGDIPISLLNN